MGAELICGSLAEELAGDIVKGIDARFEAIRPKGGQMSVVMGAGASGILLHEAMGHASRRISTEKVNPYSRISWDIRCVRRE